MRQQSIDVSIRRRITILLFFFLAALALLLVRLFIVQIVRYRTYADAASREHGASQDAPPERGAILVQDKKGGRIPIAFNSIQANIIASPNVIKNPEAVATALAPLLEISKDDLFVKVSKHDDPREVLAKGVTHATAQAVDAFHFPGISYEEEDKRVYPHGTFAAHVIGFVAKELQTVEGKYGIERLYNSDLAGEKNVIPNTTGTGGFWASIGRRIVNPPRDGSQVVLTIDENIQQKTEAVLDMYTSKWGAASGLAIVMDPKTGKILALAGRPAFDPNAFSKERDFSVFLNPAVEAVYELGSVMKPITMAAGLEEHMVKPDTTYEDTGELKIGGYTIKNFDEKAHGVETMTQVLEQSLNTGAVYVARLLGRGTEREYFTNFGFGTKTGIDLPGEVSGNIEHLISGRDIDYATASFGQGISVTPLQMISAIGAIANGGILMKPYIVDTILDDSGNESTHAPEAVRRVISPETADMLTKMLVSVVRNGYENRGGVKGYFVAGKTGTAQIPKRDGRGYSDQVIHTFVGYAPAFNPRFIALIQLNDPKGNKFAANTLTPAFHDLAEYILNYYEVPPDEK